MRTIDRIRNYITQRRLSGELRPGDKLPSYNELMSIGRGCYSTVRTSMAKLASEGLVEIRNGCGSYLAGGDTLRVRVNICSSVLPVGEMRTLLDKHLLSSGLNLEVDVHDFCEMYEWEELQRVLDTEDVVLSIVLPDDIGRLPQTQLSSFEGFAELRASLKTIPGHYGMTSLPFAGCTYQLGIGTALLREVGFNPNRVTGDVGAWWAEYARCCRNHGVNATSLFWSPESKGAFSRVYGLLFSLLGYDKKLYSGPGNLFDSAAGRRFLEIMDDTFFYPTRPHEGSFFTGGAGVCFHIGSWMTRQNETERRPDISVRDFSAVPFEFNGRRIYPASVECLECHMRDDLPVEKRRRAWSLVQLMFSREFQLDYCGLSGMMSTRADITPREHAWNSGGAWDSFFPGPGDMVVHEEQAFSREVRASLGVLLEDYKLHGCDAGAVLRRMDCKKNVEASSSVKFNSNPDGRGGL